MNSITEMLRQSGFDSCVNNLFVGCVMYADDLLLFFASIYNLQLMVDICSRPSLLNRSITTNGDCATSSVVQGVGGLRLSPNCSRYSRQGYGLSIGQLEKWTKTRNTAKPPTATID